MLYKKIAKQEQMFYNGFKEKNYMGGRCGEDYDVNIQLAENENVETEEKLANDEYEKKERVAGSN